ncbi:MAG TPA: hypothetical protein VG675_19740 [Bryobacteraceae bacterium]|nr:hypothetical protein [Bryobacteraceae bacterium]
MNLEEELRSALQRQEPSADFARRVLARVNPAPPRRWVRHAAAWAVAAALVITTGIEYYRYRQGEQAKREVLLAVRIAATQWNAVQRKVEKLNGPRDTPQATTEER